MSDITFSTGFNSVEVEPLEVPVEIRKPNYSLVAQTLSSGTVHLEPGDYHVVARLPAGQEIIRSIEVTGDQPISVDLTPDPDDLPPQASLETLQYVVGSPVQRAFAPAPAEAAFDVRALEALGAADPAAAADEGALLRVFTGDVLNGTATEIDPSQALTPRPAPALGTAHIAVRPGDARVAQLLQPGQPPLNALLPLAPVDYGIPHSGCVLVLTRDSDGMVSLDVNLENVVANAILRYDKQGMFDQAAQAAKSGALDNDRQVLEAAELVEEKKSDPIAAAVGGYGLLRFGGLGDLRDWTKHLTDWYEWLPDGAVIRGEHLARNGEHARALERFLALNVRGLPIFSDGLSYAVDRLRLYLSLSPDDSEAPPRPPEAESLYERLQRFALFADPRRPVVTYPGLDPAKPSQEPLSGGLHGFSGFDVASQMG